MLMKGLLKDQICIMKYIWITVIYSINQYLLCIIYISMPLSFQVIYC